MWPVARERRWASDVPGHGFRIGGLILVAGLMAGCGTLPVGHEKVEDWKEWYVTVDGATAHRYDSRRVEQDRIYLEHLLLEAHELAADVLHMQRVMHSNHEAYVPDEICDEVALLLRRTINLRNSFGEIAYFYRTSIGSGPNTQARGSVLGWCAGANGLALGTHLGTTFLSDKRLVKVANAEHLRYDIEDESYRKIMYEVTHPELKYYATQAHSEYARTLDDPNSPLSALLKEDPVYAALIGEGELAFADGWIRVEHIKKNIAMLLPDFDNRVRHGAMGRVMDNLWWAITRDADHMRGVVFTNVARLKRPDSAITVFTDEQRVALFRQLEPGDILLTYTAGYMSNVFLPGKFKHGIIYCGDPGARRDAGLTDTFLADFAISDEQRIRLLASAAEPNTVDGRPGDVIEAVAEGVKFTSLAYLLDTHVSRLAVLRPRLEDAERQQMLAGALAMLTAPYDFKFDFSHAGYLCCTELIYRVLDGMGPFTFALSKTSGRWVLTADDIAVSAVNDPGRLFEVVLYAELDPEREDNVARMYEDDEAVLRMRELFALGDTPALVYDHDDEEDH